MTATEAAPASTEAVAAEESGWSYNHDSAPAAQPDIPEQLTWTAAEFVEHPKSAGWYGLLALVGIVASVADYFITRDLFSSVIILFAAAAFGTFAARKPHEQQYGLDSHGVLIGNKAYSLQDFKTFSITEEGGVVSIVFMPLKRFMPPLTIYLAPEIEETVVNFLSSFLPLEQHKTDAVDSLMRRIRF